MARFRLTPNAREGLFRLIESVDQRFGARVAERVLDQFAGAFDRIGETPGIGHRREDLTEDDRIRFWSVGPSLIAYRIRPNAPVEVLFVERGERDWESILEQQG